MSLTLFIPGLFGPSDGLSIDNIPRPPALELLLARAKRQKTFPSTFYTQLCGLFGLEKRAVQDLPVAAISRLIDDDERPEGIWMRADPVNLSPGRNGLILMDSSVFSLTQHDAIVLGASLQQLFTERDWKFEIPMATRWYIKLKDNPNITTTDIDKVAGGDVQHFMPEGKEKTRWGQLMNEVQMLLHDSEVNRDREERGEITINSLWFWGIGQLPEILNRKWSMLMSNDPVAQGLAMLSSTPFSCLPKTTEEITKNADMSSDVLVVLTAALSHCHYWDYPAWQETVAAIEQDWFNPILNAIHEGKLNKIMIITESNKFIINKRSLLKFWRRKKSLMNYM